ncbi:hypothetical protein [Luteitalea sp.]
MEGILAFAERVLARAADLWVQASLTQRQRFQQLFFLEGNDVRRPRLRWNRRDCTSVQRRAGDLCGDLTNETWIHVNVC